MLLRFRNGMCLQVAILVLGFCSIANGQVTNGLKVKRDDLPVPDFYHVRNGLVHFYKKLNNQKEVTVAFLGGSITYNPGWRPMICDYLRERYPDVKFHFISAGIPSLGSYHIVSPTSKKVRIKVNGKLKEIRVFNS